jgi:hypothetical protein
MEIPTSELHKMTIEEFDTEKLLINAARQRDQRNLQDVLIVDVDCHHYENESIKDIIEFIEDPVLRHTGQVYSGGGTGAQTPLLPGVVGYQDLAGRVMRYPLRKLEKHDPDGKHRDVQLSLKWMEAMGVDYVSLFPTPMLLLGLHPQPEVEAGMSRAYNRWIVEKSYKMVQDFGDKPGVIGFCVVSTRYKPVYDNAYMKTYALMEEMGKPLAFHAGYNWNDPLLGNTNRFIVTHAMGQRHALRQLDHQRPARTVPQASRDLDRIRARLGAVDNAAARQRLQDALVRGAGAQEAAERIHEGHVLLVAADGDAGRHGRARDDVQDDQCREPAPVVLRLPALGHGRAVDHLGPAVPRREGQAQHPRRERPETVRSRRLRPISGLSADDLEHDSN